MSPEPGTTGAPPAALPTDGALTPELVRSEVGRAMNDKTHPHYQHFHGWPSDGAAAWLAGLYQRIPGASTPVPLGDSGIEVTARPTSVEIGQGIDVVGRPTTEPGDLAANTAATDELRREWGDQFDTHYEAARSEMQARLEEKGEAVLDEELASALGSGMSRASITKYLASEYAKRRRRQ